MRHSHRPRPPKATLTQAGVGAVAAEQAADDKGGSCGGEWRRLNRGRSFTVGARLAIPWR